MSTTSSGEPIATDDDVASVHPSVEVSAPTHPDKLRVAVRGTYIAFVACGFAFANWASRIPQVKAHLHLSPTRLGLTLLAIAAGSIAALPLSGSLIHRLGTRRTVASTAVLLAVGLAMVAVGYLMGTIAVVIGLFVFGFAIGAWDVAMNVQAALVERHLGRSIMPRFHAGFSIGAVLGALLGSLMVATGVPVTVHLLLTAVAVAAIVSWGVTGFLDDGTSQGAVTQEPTARRGALAAWREPRTLMIGLFVLGFAFAEGTGNDWISVAMIDSYHVPAAVGTLGYAIFLSAMTVGRWFGPGLLDRYGRVLVIRVEAAIGIAGTLLFVFAPFVPLALIGVLLWGVGVSLGFPVGLSAGAEDPRLAPARVSVIASIGYFAFLAGPPLIGFLGQHVTVLRAVTAVAALLSVTLLISSAIAPNPPQQH